MRRFVIASVAALVAALSLAAGGAAKPGSGSGDSTVGPGGGGCLLGVCCPSAWTLGAYIHAYGQVWYCWSWGWEPVQP